LHSCWSIIILYYMFCFYFDYFCFKASLEKKFGKKKKEKRPQPSSLASARSAARPARARAPLPPLFLLLTDGPHPLLSPPSGTRRSGVFPFLFPVRNRVGNLLPNQSRNLGISLALIANRDPIKYPRCPASCFCI